MTMTQRWQRILNSDDGSKVVDLVEGLRVQDRDALVAMALSQEKLPNNVLSSLVQAGAFDSRWIGRARDLDRKHFLRALIWRAGQVPEAQMQHEILLGYGMAMGAYVYNHDSWDIAKRRGQQVIALLDTWPKLAQQLVLGKPVPHKNLFDLAAMRMESDWLVRSGLAEQVLHEAVRNNRHLFLFATLEGQAPLKLFNTWMESHPGLRQAWEGVRERDRHEMDVFRDWYRQWGTGGWEASPLKQWCQQAKEDHAGTIAGSPLDHPHFAFPWNKIGLPNFQRLAKVWASRMKYIENDVCEVLELNRVLRRSIVNDAHEVDLWIQEGPLPAPLDPVVAGLINQEVWVGELMRTQDGANHLQGLLDDERVQSLLGNVKTASIVDWVAHNTAWHHWRDSKGRSLLDIRAYAEGGGWGQAKLTKRAAMTLAKKAPHLLLHQNARGVRTLDGFDLNPAHRAQVYRHLLGQHVQTTTTRRAQTRAM